jgi:hypothetical protein
MKKGITIILATVIAVTAMVTIGDVNAVKSKKPVKTFTYQCPSGKVVSQEYTDNLNKTVKSMAYAKCAKKINPKVAPNDVIYSKAKITCDNGKVAFNAFPNSNGLYLNLSMTQLRATKNQVCKGNGKSGQAIYKCQDGSFGVGGTNSCIYGKIQTYSY